MQGERVCGPSESCAPGFWYLHFRSVTTRSTLQIIINQCEKERKGEGDGEKKRQKRPRSRLCWTVQRNVNGSYIIFGRFVHHIGRDSGGVVFLNFFIQLGKGGVSTIKKHSSAPNKKHSSTLGLGICWKKASYQLISILSGCLQLINLSDISSIL